MGQHGSQAGLIRQRVDQSAADYDRVTHAESFKRIGHHHARTDWPRQIDVIGDLNIVDDSLKNFVHVARRRQQGGPLQTLDYVVLGLLLPGALSF